MQSPGRVPLLVNLPIALAVRQAGGAQMVRQDIVYLHPAVALRAQGEAAKKPLAS